MTSTTDIGPAPMVKMSSEPETKLPKKKKSKTFRELVKEMYKTIGLPLIGKGSIEKPEYLVIKLNSYEYEVFDKDGEFIKVNSGDLKDLDKIFKDSDMISYKDFSDKYGKNTEVDGDEVIIEPVGDTNKVITEIKKLFDK